MTDMLIDDDLLESECNAHGPAARFEHLEELAEEYAFILTQFGLSNAAAR